MIYQLCLQFPQCFFAEPYFACKECLDSHVKQYTKPRIWEAMSVTIFSILENVEDTSSQRYHSTKKPVTIMLTYPWKCTVLHCNHLGNTWKPPVLMTRHFDYCPSASEGDNQSVRSSAPVWMSMNEYECIHDDDWKQELHMQADIYM